MDKEQKIQRIIDRYVNTDDYGRDQIDYMIFCLDRIEKESGER
jgi:hypothetical protein